MARKIREDWTLIEKPQLVIHLDYKHLTAGDLGNTLIRLQACVRSLQGLTAKRYVDKLDGEPHLVIHSFRTGQSADLWVAVAGLIFNIAVQPYWNDFAKLAWRRLIAATYFAIKGELPGTEPSQIPSQEIDAHLSRGNEEDLRLEVNLNKLDKDQAKKLSDFISSVIYSSNSVRLSDEETEVTIIKKSRDEDDNSQARMLP